MQLNAHTERFTLTGAAGLIEALRDRPAGTPRGVAVIAHPHPLFGGTMDNKVVQTLARAFVQTGWEVVRFNFRGVGASQGEHDAGRGEAQDMLEVVRQVAPTGAVALAGFSFGAFVTTHVLQRTVGRRARGASGAGGHGGQPFLTPPPYLLPRTTAPWCCMAKQMTPCLCNPSWTGRAPQTLPVTVVPAGGHFFHGQLPLLKGLGGPPPDGHALVKAPQRACGLYRLKFCRPTELLMSLF